MSEIEKKQLLVTIQSVQNEISDAPYGNKSQISMTTSWLMRLSVKAGEKYLSSNLADALSHAASRLGEFARNLPNGIFHFPWF